MVFQRKICRYIKKYIMLSDYKLKRTGKKQKKKK